MEDLQVCQVLHELLRVCHDGHEHYHRAAHRISDAGLSRLLRALAVQRRGFVEQLVSLINELDGDPNRATVALSGLGRTRRADTHFAITMTESIALLEQGEVNTRDSYEMALSLDLPQDIHRLISAQYDDILAAEARLRRYFKRA